MSAVFALAATYVNVHPVQPDVTGGDGSATSLSSWNEEFATSEAGAIVIAATADNNGGMTGGANTIKLSTVRNAGYGTHVFQGGVYEDAGSNSFNLSGANGGGTDVTYAVLKAAFTL